MDASVNEQLQKIANFALSQDALAKVLERPSPASDSNYPSSKVALFDRARFFVVQHLQDANLSADTVASGLNCSRRALYYAFEGSGETVASYIQRLRLEACVRDLQSLGPHGKPITDVALSWGFANHSHFSRVFRMKTGTTPTEFRRRIQQT